MSSAHPVAWRWKRDDGVSRVPWNLTGEEPKDERPAFGKFVCEPLYAHPEAALIPLEKLGMLKCAECASRRLSRVPCVHVTQVYETGKQNGHFEEKHGYNPEAAPEGPTGCFRDFTVGRREDYSWFVRFPGEYRDGPYLEETARLIYKQETERRAAAQEGRCL